MPTLGEMAQLSRPYQVALGAMAVLALVWFVVLHGHKGNPSEPSPPSLSARPSSPGASSKPSPSGVYHGAAPGLEGLTRDISKAHGAVALSQQKAAELRRKSAQASNEASSSKGASGSPAVSGGQASYGVPANHTTSPANRAASGADTSAPVTPKRPVQQATVERELTHGKTVLLVFWNPKSSVDMTVRSQAIAVGRGSKGKVAVHVARAGQVGLFGPVTEVAHVYQTPTVLIVGRHGLISVLTGLVDDFGLSQAVREAEHANR